jgi:hypothetical protein
MIGAYFSASWDDNHSSSDNISLQIVEHEGMSCVALIQMLGNDEKSLGTHNFL